MNKVIISIKWLFLILLTVFIISPGGADSGGDLYAAGDYSSSISWYEQTLRTTTGASQAPVMNNIATCYVALGQPEKAAEYYTRAVTVDPSYGRGWINLGVVQEKLDRAGDALVSYGKVTGDPGLVAEAAVKKGTLLAAQQKLNEALDAFRSAEAGATGQVAVDMYTGMGGIEFMLKDTAAAEEHFLKATRLDPSGAAMAWTNLGVLRISQQRYADAKTAFETAIRNDSQGKTKSALYLNKLGAMGGA